MKIPDRRDDSAEEFAKQQEALAAQIEENMAARLDKELRNLIEKEGEK